MPYVFMEELGEGMEAADVVERDEYETLKTERDVFELERDENAQRIDTLKAELESAKAKFAEAFLTEPTKMKARQSEDIKQDGRATSYSELFTGRNRHAD